MPSALAAACLYLFVTFLQARRLRGQGTAGAGLVYGLAAAAIVLHGYSAITSIQSPGGINLGFFKVSSLIFWLINVSFLLSLARRPLQNLLVILFPLSSIAVLISALAPGNASPFDQISTGLLLHIGSSVLAYAVLTIAACQAALVALQDHQLKRHHTGGLAQLLPPLQLMETMLFEILWVGLLLLTAAIGTGMLFLDDIFAQSLVHKTVLTIAAWGLFATLLWGRHQLGWRSQTAVRFTLAGFLVLMLGYFGSKLVLELILGRV
ncbi:MAG: cytochrome c biogenesis protein CcsA [Halieaceae bacterium]